MSGRNGNPTDHPIMHAPVVSIFASVAIFITGLPYSCRDCIVAHLAACMERGEEGRCPTCLRGPVQEHELVEVFRPKIQQDDGIEGSTLLKDEVVLRRNDFRSSTKLDALMQSLRECPCLPMEVA